MSSSSIVRRKSSDLKTLQMVSLQCSSRCTVKIVRAGKVKSKTYGGRRISLQLLWRKATPACECTISIAFVLVLGSFSLGSLFLPMSCDISVPGLPLSWGFFFHRVSYVVCSSPISHNGLLCTFSRDPSAFRPALSLLVTHLRSSNPLDQRKMIDLRRTW